MNAHLSRRRLFIIGLSSICIAHVARADSATDAAAPIARLNAALEARSAGFAQRVAMLEPVLEQSFDLPTVLRASIGFGWATLSAADQQNLLQAFRRYIAANYCGQFHRRADDPHHAGAAQPARWRRGCADPHR